MNFIETKLPKENEGLERVAPLKKIKASGNVITRENTGTFGLGLTFCDQVHDIRPGEITAGRAEQNDEIRSACVKKVFRWTVQTVVGAKFWFPGGAKIGGRMRISMKFRVSRETRLVNGSIGFPHGMDERSRNPRKEEIVQSTGVKSERVCKIDC